MSVGSSFEFEIRTPTRDFHLPFLSLEHRGSPDLLDEDIAPNPAANTICHTSKCLYFIKADNSLREIV